MALKGDILMKCQDVIKNAIITAGTTQILGEIAMRTGGPVAIGVIASALAVIGRSGPMSDRLCMVENAYHLITHRDRFIKSKEFLRKAVALKDFQCSLAKFDFFRGMMPISDAIHKIAFKLKIIPEAFGMGAAFGMAATLGLILLNGPGRGIIALGSLVSGVAAGGIILSADAKREKSEKAFAESAALEKESCGKSLLIDLVNDRSPLKTFLGAGLISSSFYKDSDLYTVFLDKMFNSWNLKTENSNDEIVEPLKEDPFKNARLMGIILTASIHMSDSAISEKAAIVIEKLLDKPINAKDITNRLYKVAALCSLNFYYAQKHPEKFALLSKRIFEEFQGLYFRFPIYRKHLLPVIAVALKGVAAGKDQESYRNLTQLLKYCSEKESILSALEMIKLYQFPAYSFTLVLFAAKQMGDSDLNATLSGKWHDVVNNSVCPKDRMLARAVAKEARLNTSLEANPAIR